MHRDRRNLASRDSRLARSAHSVRHSYSLRADHAYLYFEACFSWASGYCISIFASMGYSASTYNICCTRLKTDIWLVIGWHEFSRVHSFKEPATTILHGISECIFYPLISYGIKLRFRGQLHSFFDTIDGPLDNR